MIALIALHAKVTTPAAFSVEEVVDLTMQFYRRNYIEGLFLSSGIFKSGDYTMERLVEVAKILRTRERFNGYIHLKWFMRLLLIFS